MRLGATQQVGQHLSPRTRHGSIGTNSKGAHVQMAQKLGLKKESSENPEEVSRPCE
jgi:hypothetical protein